MLELRDVSIRLGPTPLVQHLTLSVAPGEIVTLMGPSGSGKSTLLSYIAGDLPEAFQGSGVFLLDGKSLDGIAPERRRIGRLFQDDLLFPHMSVGENLAFALPDQKSSTAVVAEALRLAGLAGYEQRPPHTLSGGQRARVALMRALLARPAAILLDEPFNKLDQALRLAVRELTFRHIAERLIPAVLVSHDPADAPPRGRLLAIGRDGEVRDV